jgi:hypothetical protein
MRNRAQYFARFPGRAAVLEAIRAAGSWTPAQMDAWARRNGGNAETYEALRWLVRKGKVSYTPNLWVAAPARFSVAASQRRRAS